VTSEAVARLAATVAALGLLVAFALAVTVPVWLVLLIGAVLAGAVAISLWRRHFDECRLARDRESARGEPWVGPVP
jgi:capsid protein